MSDEKKNLPDGAAGQEHGAEQDIEAAGVGVSAETEAEGSSQSPEEQLERIAAEQDVPIEKDPKEAQAAGEAGAAPSDNERDLRGGDTKEEEDTSAEPPD
ncbi:hypothetical protein [Brevibacterium aurantiacum]|uniref:Uncharacterized protein n=1 Tax=Brevibacterium aurantiacum TaxID=273384 RepID=A0A2H1KET2_BREAU|nr:hypothetical protein [Brevibacterium aurantiacum]AZL06689.1 hypothetical protein CXR24_14700 [Brevibacterium aurantiacum]GEB23636.1 hypothetical protein BAU01nite_23690 [Brevibacterium aurantiacum]SMX98345.1 hypothetical protein BAUR9175_03426 [Brevibacterium aurantiacum]